MLSILIKSAAKITQDLLLVTSSRSSFRNLPRITKYTAYRDQRDLGVKVVYIKIWNIFIKIRSKIVRCVLQVLFLTKYLYHLIRKYVLVIARFRLQLTINLTSGN